MKSFLDRTKAFLQSVVLTIRAIIRPRRNMQQAQIEAIMNEVEAPAVLALRPYPPVDLPETLSQVGGLPILPAEADWPRTNDGTPLHFLARIDCADLPEPRAPLPDSGILQFFARIDADMDWAEQPSDHHCRVLYARTAAGREVSPPPDLRPIMDGYHDYDREMRLPNEPETRVYPRWPLMFRTIRSWPDWPHSIQNSDEATRTAYREAVGRARAAEIVRTTGLPTTPYQRARWGDRGFRSDGMNIMFLPAVSDSRGSTAFPHVWIIAERIARAFAVMAHEEAGTWREGRKSREGVDAKQLVTDLEHMNGQALSWMQRARSAGLDSPLGKVEAKEFEDWLTQLMADNRHEVSYALSRAIKRGMSHAIKYCGGSRAAAAHVPAGYMNQLEEEHLPISPDTYGILVAPPRRRFRTSHHQLLGRASTSQEVEPEDGEVLLLHLVSDRGVDFMFCDVGEIQFWIHADDLAARRFDRVTANTQGG
jgi:hypothetical protein